MTSTSLKAPFLKSTFSFRLKLWLEFQYHCHVTKPSRKKFLIVPCFNEANRIAPAEYWKELEGSSVILVFVNDASTDNTVSKIDSMNLKFHRTVTIHENSGKANAIREGFLYIQRIIAIDFADSYVGFVDADMAFSVQDIIRMFDLAEVSEFEAVFASRVKLSGRNINRKRIRHITGRLIMTFLSISGFAIPYDSQAGLKVFRYTPKLIKCFQNPFDTRWFFELELLLRFKRNFGVPLKVWEEPLFFWNETKGSKLIAFSSISILFQIAYLFFEFVKLAHLEKDQV